MNRDALRELIEKVEAGTVPNRSLPWSYALMPENAMLARNAYDGSLDAAVALLEAVLPGWDADIEVRPVAGLHDATVFGPREDEWFSGTSADTPARALLLATLKALEARDE